MARRLKSIIGILICVVMVFSLGVTASAGSGTTVHVKMPHAENSKIQYVVVEAKYKDSSTIEFTATLGNR